MQHYGAPAFSNALPIGGPASFQSQDKSNLSHLDLSSHLGPVQGSGGLYIQFFYANVWVQPLEEPGRWDTRLCVAKQIKGDRLTCATTPITEEQAAWQFPDEWRAFKTNEAMPTNGTPIHELPSITQSQLAYLALHNVRSIEDLAELPSDRAGSLGLEVAAAHKVAVAWLEKAHANGALVAEATRSLSVELELERLRKREADRDQELLELRAQLKAIATMGGQVPAQVAQAASGVTVAVEGEVIVKREGVTDPFDLGTNGTINGNDDLDGPADDLPPDPLASSARRRR